MTGPSNKPIPRELKQSFREAIQRYEGWKFGGSEPRIFVGDQLVTISVVCDFVLDHDNAKMSTDDFKILHDTFRDISERSIKESLGRDDSYHNGARCLHQLISVKNKRYENS